MHLDETLLSDTLKKQIFSIVIEITIDKDRSTSNDWYEIILTPIFSLYRNMKYFNFKPSYMSFQHIPFNISPPTFVSSTLLELHAKIRCYEDCLYILDGRFNQLHTLPPLSGNYINEVNYLH
jgi:hypothetical protein